jgi:RNA polymerase sigma-70 factor (ECF subfamily)
MIADAERDVLKAHTRYLKSYALRRVRDPDLADDLVQDTFVAALTSAGRFEGRSAARTWLVGILKHKILDVFRHRARSPIVCEERSTTDQGTGAEPLETAPNAGAGTVGYASVEGDPEATAAWHRFWTACQAHLDTMPAQAANAFLMAEVLGHGSDEVCRALGMSNDTLSTTLYRTRKRLRRALEASRPA